MFGLAINDQLPQIGRKAPTVGALRWMEIDEETGHSVGVEAIGLAMDRPRRLASLLGTLRRELAEQDDRPN
jgi:hypothetical protein